MANVRDKDGIALAVGDIILVSTHYDQYTFIKDKIVSITAQAGEVRVDTHYGNERLVRTGERIADFTHSGDTNWSGFGQIDH